MELRKVNELINNNIGEFEEGIDILDLKGNKNLEILAKDLEITISNRTKNFYLLSEQGYMILVGFMKTEKAKELRKQIIKLSNSNVKDMHIRRLENRGENFFINFNL